MEKLCAVVAPSLTIIPKDGDLIIVLHRMSFKKGGRIILISNPGAGNDPG